MVVKESAWNEHETMDMKYQIFGVAMVMVPGQIKENFTTCKFSEKWNTDSRYVDGFGHNLSFYFIDKKKNR